MGLEGFLCRRELVGDLVPGRVISDQSLLVTF